MRLILGGVRGTNPVAKPEFMTFGGETTSFLVEGKGGECILVDAGTGVKALGARLMRSSPSRSVLLLMTHYHLDHIMGLPSLGLIYSPDWSIQMVAPVRQGHRIEEIMPRIFQDPFWPLQVEDLASHVHYGTLDGESSRAPVCYGGLEIRWCPVPHPGGCTAYRLDEPATGTSVVIATDVEWAKATPEQQRGFLQLCREPRPASLLLWDGQYTPAEYPKHAGWGHSTGAEGAEIARQAGVAQYLVTHHAPTNDDRRLAEMEAELKRAYPFAAFAREGTEIVPAGEPPAAQQ